MPINIDEAGLVTIFPEIEGIRDPALRRGVVAIWLEIAQECAWSRLEDIPKNLEAEKGRRLVDHVRGVTRIALSMAETAKDHSGTEYDRDALIAMCLLHDVSKPLECEPDPDGRPGSDRVLAGRKSKLGKMIQHAVYATHKCFAHGLPLEVAHVVNTHTHQSAVRSITVEGAYVFYADYADSDAVLVPATGKGFVSRWHME
ncbi:HD domain-containing protein [Falsiroseomonas sp. CW058]|uniref:HD domain-containing protein n=1 Tax=Falsiroseomonas sp. CW058 TaxID=3388664 RepID=UPI003D322DB5